MDVLSAASRNSTRSSIFWGVRFGDLGRILNRARIARCNRTLTFILSFYRERRQKLPEADAAGVYVDEASLRVVADAAGPLCERCAAELR